MSLLTLFEIFFLINFLTIGGGYVMLPLLHGYFVEQYALLTNKEFLEAIALGQLTPGPLTIMNVFIGYKVLGIPGSLAATVGTYMPSLIVATLVSKYYLRFKGSKAVEAVFTGIKLAVVGMLCAIVVTLAGSSIVGPAAAGICLVSFSLMAFTEVDPTFVIIGAGAAGAAFL